MAKFQPAHSPTARPVLHQPRAPQIAAAWRPLDFAWRASARAALRLLGPSPQRSLHRLRPFTHRCLASPAQTWDPPALPSACSTRSLSNEPRAPRAGLLAQRWLCRLWLLLAQAAEAGRCALVLNLSWTASAPQSLPFLNRTRDPPAAAGAISNLQPERRQARPRSGPCPPEAEARGMGLGSRPWHRGHREGSRCSSAAAVSARELARRAGSSPRRCTPGRGAGQHGLCCRCLAWAVK